MADNWKHGFAILMELNIIYFFVLILHLDQGIFPSIAGFLLAYVVGIIIYMGLTAKLPQTYVAIIFVAPVLALILFVFHYHLTVSLLVGLFLSYRCFIYFVQGKPVSTYSLLLHSFFWMPIIYVSAVAMEYPYSNNLLFLFVSQLFLVIFLYSGESFFSLKGNRPLQKIVFIASASVLGAVLAFAGVFATLGKWLIGSSFEFIGKVLTFITKLIAIPLFYLLGLHDWEVKPRGQEEVSSVELEENEEIVPEVVPQTGNMFDNPLVIAFILLFIALVVFFILRKKRVRRDEEDETAQPMLHMRMTKEADNFKLFRRKQKPPENQVRRLMYSLEKQAQKKKHGRFPHETLEEWLKRETFLKEEFIQLYAKVRYGDIELSLEERQQCIHLADDLRKVIKKLNKAG
ncbi:DUF4129 domain-containing protein [Sutcliffiella deserti]|uniref:DUF4129 domain-containing protein n=1 Tax=Sutcliffiella deserti TaxID=2875501 RepID=UPI001CBA947D|nr:DUF4129 domain-containing protein [Sutcliffiella deserti]